MTRILTKPVREHFGELRGVTGATMEDGTVYRSSRSGSFEVDRADHVHAMLRDPQVAQDIAVCGHTPRGITHWRTCPVCHHSCWSWQETCPRDGTPTIEVTHDD